MILSTKRAEKSCAKWYQILRNRRIIQAVDQQFPKENEAWAIKQLIARRILPILDGKQTGSRKKSLEKAHADLRVVLNANPPLQPQMLRSGIVEADGLSPEEFIEKCEAHLKLHKELDGKTAKAASAYAKARKKADKFGRHRVLCSGLEWETLTRWKDGVSVALRKKELKIFADKMTHKTNAKNLSLTIRRLGLNRRNQNRILF